LPVSLINTHVFVKAAGVEAFRCTLRCSSIVVTTAATNLLQGDHSLFWPQNRCDDIANVQCMHVKIYDIHSKTQHNIT